MMRFGHIELFVRDPLKAKEFYEEILGVEVIFVQEGQFVWLKIGDTEIMLRPGNPHPVGKTYQEANAALVLYTDDLDTTAATLRARGLTFQGTDGTDKCLTFQDIDGNWFQLVNPQDH